jgi:hypothetical protein
LLPRSSEDCAVLCRSFNRLCGTARDKNFYRGIGVLVKNEIVSKRFIQKPARGGGWSRIGAGFDTVLIFNRKYQKSGIF